MNTDEKEYKQVFGKMLRQIDCLISDGRYEDAIRDIKLMESYAINMQHLKEMFNISGKK